MREETVAGAEAGGGFGVADDERPSIDPNIRKVLEELEIDLSDKFARPLTPEVLAAGDVIVTMGRSVGSIEIPETARHLDWRVGDPAGADLDEVRRVRDDIERRVEQFADELRLPLTVGNETRTGD